MCGIIGAANFGKNTEPVNEWVLNQFEDQKSRGMQGFGVITVQDNGSYRISRATEPAKAIIDLYMNPARFVVMHHRIPTSSDNKIAQTHPLFVSHHDFKHNYLVVHNGIISNERELKQLHEAAGFNYTTAYQAYTNYEKFNDSESLAIELASFIENKGSEIRAQGSAACIVLQIDKDTDKVTRLFFVRNNGSPLNMAKKEGEIRLSSEGPGEEIKVDTLYSCNTTDWKLSKQICIIPQYTAPARSVVQYNNDTEWERARHTAWDAPFHRYPACATTRILDTTADEEPNKWDNEIEEDQKYEDNIDFITEQVDGLLAEVAQELDDEECLPYFDAKSYAERFQRILEDTQQELIRLKNDATMCDDDLINERTKPYVQPLTQSPQHLPL
jgi:predicted glutamine amidotransferase